MIEPDRPVIARGETGQDDPGQFEPAFDPAPLILTLALAAEDQARFDRLRTAHFPPERNFIDAHITLFHHLPPEFDAEIRAHVAALSAVTAPFAVAVTGLRSLGRGTAFSLEASELSALRSTLARTWADALSAQDRQAFRPHVTVQNKVGPAEARTLRDRLSREFAPFSIAATGLDLWRYRGGPWERAGRFAFTCRPADPPEHRRRSPSSDPS